MFLKKIPVTLFLILIVQTSYADQIIKVGSPDGAVQLGLIHQADGSLFYSVTYKGRAVIAPSILGMKLKKPEFSLEKFDLLHIDSSVHDDTWKPVWGEVSSIRDHYRQLVLKLSDLSGSGIQLEIIFRVFNEGVGFRYSFPQQPKLNHFIIADELTQFAMTGDHKVFWIPGDYDTNEYSYYTTKLSGIPITVFSLQNNGQNLNRNSE